MAGQLMRSSDSFGRLGSCADVSGEPRDSSPGPPLQYEHDMMRFSSTQGQGAAFHPVNFPPIGNLYLDKGILTRAGSSPAK